MRIITVFFLIVIALAQQSCSKQGFINTADARVLMADTIRFDTVFATVGSVTQSFTILNDNKQKLRLQSVKLMGGTTSPYKINIDGVAGIELSNIELNSGDSIYVFVAVTVDPNNDNTPFIVRDSIQVNYNGVSRYVQLTAFGRNAHFIDNAIINKNITWTNDLPYVITKGVKVAADNTLTIEKGCAIYLHADAPFVVEGTLAVNGTPAEQVSFQGDRLDAGYRDLSASWPGIFFNESSKNNLLQYVVVKNAYQGIRCFGPSLNAAPKLFLNACVLDNIYDIGLGGSFSNIKAVNCRITNCGANLVFDAGGQYELVYCTIASYGNSLVEHKRPVLFITDADENGTSFPLNLKLQNSIIWGEGGNIENEVQVNKKGSAVFEVLLDHNIVKAKALAASITVNKILLNEDPLFDSINVSRRYYDFRIEKNPSPAIDAGIPVSYNTDIDGRQRTGLPDLGCYTKP